MAEPKSVATGGTAGRHTKPASGRTQAPAPAASGRRRRAPKSYKKLTMNIAPEAFDRMQRYADSRDLTITELIKEALTLEEIVYSHRNYQWIYRDPESGRELEIKLVLGGVSANDPIPT